MIEINAIYGGPAISKTERVSAANVMFSIIDEMPDATSGQCVTAFYERLRDDEDYVKAALIHLGYSTFYNIRRNSPAAQKKATKRAAQIRQTATKLAGAIRSAILLETVMPNGKPLAECTGKECAKFGGWLSKIAAKIRPADKVGAVLSEVQVRKLFA